jgi:anthranilate synthase/aminodeoxychorismate synthase-like glutamine amidotransferase|tara:strand:+ start:334 stop:888 length:555 start_codon:yes stop_codon:yes gene_type:complete
MILIIDNFDSFAYNLVQRVGELGYKPLAKRNTLTIPEVLHLKPTHIIISPGPGKPKDAGNTNEIIKQFAGKIPILGVCLGHQCIAEVFGSKIIKNKPAHGMQDLIHHHQKGIYKNIELPFKAARYHSLIVKNIPEDFELTAWNNTKQIMGIRNKQLKLHGVQFHPESILTKAGFQLLRNFLQCK